MAGETQAALAATAEAEWIQVLLRDAMFGDVQVQGWEGHLAPFTSVWSQNCVVAKHLPLQHVVDAKSLYDAVIKDAAGSRADRRTAVDLCILRDVHLKSGSRVRWVPHHLMVVDSMTKADPGKANDALGHLMRRGHLLLTTEAKEIGSGRGLDRHNRSKAASRRQIEGGAAAVLRSGSGICEDGVEIEGSRSLGS